MLEASSGNLSAMTKDGYLGDQVFVRLIHNASVGSTANEVEHQVLTLGGPVLKD